MQIDTGRKLGSFLIEAMLSHHNGDILRAKRFVERSFDRNTSAKKLSGVFSKIRTINFRTFYNMLYPK